VLDLDQAHALQVLHGLPDCDTSNRQGRHEFALRGERVAGPKLAISDTGEKPRLHEVGSLLADGLAVSTGHTTP
jgi:hypothetical protein